MSYWQCLAILLIAAIFQNWQLTIWRTGCTCCPLFWNTLKNCTEHNIICRQDCFLPCLGHEELQGQIFCLAPFCFATWQGAYISQPAIWNAFCNFVICQDNCLLQHLQLSSFPFFRSTYGNPVWSMPALGPWSWVAWGKAATTVESWEPKKIYWLQYWINMFLIVVAICRIIYIYIDRLWWQPLMFLCCLLHSVA